MSGSYIQRQTPNGAVLVRHGDGAVIPMAPGNADYAAFQAAQASGQAYVQIEQPAEAPSTIAAASPFQLQTVLSHMSSGGKPQLETVNEWLATRSPALAIAWDKAPQLTPASDVVRQVQAGMGWTDQFVTDLFEHAQAIKA